MSSLVASRSLNPSSSNSTELSLATGRLDLRLEEQANKIDANLYGYGARQSEFEMVHSERFLGKCAAPRAYWTAVFGRPVEDVVREITAQRTRGPIRELAEFEAGVAFKRWMDALEFHTRDLLSHGGSTDSSFFERAHTKLADHRCIKFIRSAPEERSDYHVNVQRRDRIESFFENAPHFDSTCFVKTERFGIVSLQRRASEYSSDDTFYAVGFNVHQPEHFCHVIEPGGAVQGASFKSRDGLSIALDRPAEKLDCESLLQAAELARRQHADAVSFKAPGINPLVTVVDLTLAG